MKKKLWFLCSILFLFFPLHVKADAYISSYLIDATVLENGDVHMKEYFVYKGSYNGAIKNLYYGRGNIFDTFLKEDLYSPDDIVLQTIGEINPSANPSFSDMEKEVTPFVLNNNATVGSKGYYSLKKDSRRYTYQIYNPGGTKGFFIEYTLKNVVVLHEDVKEVWLNIFNEVTDSMENVEVRIHLSNDNKTLRAWAHGPLQGDITLNSETMLTYTIDALVPGDTFSIRFAFDGTVFTTNKSNIDALALIVEEETKWAEEANTYREEQRKLLEELEKKHKKQALIFQTFGIFWIIGLVFLVLFVYRKYDKEHTSTFKGKYFRDIPSDIDPPIVSYLMNKKIDSNSLSAVILNLIEKKIITYEEISKKDYKFIYSKKDEGTAIERATLNLLFDGKDEITLSEFKAKAKKEYNTFLVDYDAWHRLCMQQSAQKNYYEDKITIKFFSCFYSILGLISLYFYNSCAPVWLLFLILILSIVSFVYFIIFYKRTIIGNEEYLKWTGLKNFMNDFGTMDTKSLPEIHLWEKYLVYAVVLGCAEKLARTMKVKIEEMGNTIDTTDLLVFNTRFYIMSDLNQVVNQSINNAISTAKSVASSHNTSGGGFGGGFSSGGGFSGGGGGSTGHF